MSAIARYTRHYVATYAKATTRQRTAGANWYPTARAQVAALASLYHRPVAVMAAVAAALSNSKTWPENVRLTDAVLSAYTRGERPRGHFGHCIRQAVAIWDANDASLISGPKTAPFARALAGDDAAAVIDRHMVRAARRRKSLTLLGHRELQTALRLGAAETGESVTTFQAIVWTVARES